MNETNQNPSENVEKIERLTVTYKGVNINSSYVYIKSETLPYNLLLFIFSALLYKSNVVNMFEETSNISNLGVNSTENGDIESIYLYYGEDKYEVTFNDEKPNIGKNLEAGFYCNGISKYAYASYDDDSNSYYELIPYDDSLIEGLKVFTPNYDYLKSDDDKVALMSYYIQYIMLYSVKSRIKESIDNPNKNETLKEIVKLMALEKYAKAVSDRYMEITSAVVKQIDKYNKKQVEFEAAYNSFIGDTEIYKRDIERLKKKLQNEQSNT